MDSSSFQWNQDTVLVILIVIVSIIIGRQIPRWLAGVPFVTPEEARQNLADTPDALILDVRHEHQFGGKDGHLEGALNVSLIELMGRVKQIREELKEYADQPVLVVCKNDQLSSRAARILRKNGMTKVAILKGGLKAWKKAGLPVEVEPQAES